MQAVRSTAQPCRTGATEAPGGSLGGECEAQGRRRASGRSAVRTGERRAASGQRPAASGERAQRKACRAADEQAGLRLLQPQLGCVEAAVMMAAMAMI